MPYTFSTKPSPTYATGQLDNYATQVKDGSHEAIGASGFQTSDATATPVTSPVALTTSTKLINIPTNASQMTFVADGIIKVSELSAFGSYASIPLGVPVTINVARQTAIYFQAATTANLSFYFSII